ncbi:hypothetical protein IU474_25020 [Nocardia otitidiscaviarum]|uniref:hypothetical protein n=1 Tax=Nocardia otitidiscaviarum TaxID=1823 RepID=UPI001894415C|nr:hypothetical protein [Nocardia otitidiscaviarum]MBF6240309.1 hypothetical protein [Nocardia otitidiscaviarum]
MTARDRSHLCYLHRDDGIWPVGEDGWPITAEQLTEPDPDIRKARNLPDSTREIIDVEPESVEDIEPNAS